MEGGEADRRDCVARGGGRAKVSRGWWIASSDSRRRKSEEPAGKRTGNRGRFVKAREQAVIHDLFSFASHRVCDIKRTRRVIARVRFTTCLLRNFYLGNGAHYSAMKSHRKS